MVKICARFFSLNENGNFQETNLKHQDDMVVP